ISGGSVAAGSEQQFFGIDFGARVDGERVEGGRFVEERIGRAVDAARGSENKAANAARGSHFDERTRGGAVHFGGQLLVFVAGGVADDRGEVNQRVAAFHGRGDGGCVANIAADEFAIWI